MARENRFKMSQERLDELKAELEYLQTVREKEVAALIKEARSFGDLSENSEYDEAKNDQAFVESRIAQLEKMLTNVRIINENELSTDVVGIGCTVKIKDLDTGDIEDYAIVSSNEADATLGKISDEAPVGKAMIGKSKQECFEVKTPSGLILRYEIIEIGKQKFE